MERPSSVELGSSSAAASLVDLEAFAAVETVVAAAGPAWTLERWRLVVEVEYLRLAARTVCTLQLGSLNRWVS